MDDAHQGARGHAHYGIRTPVGIKIYGADIKKIEDLGTQIEALLPKVQGTRSVFSERTSVATSSISSGIATHSRAMA